MSLLRPRSGKVQLLRRVPLFAGLSQRQLEQIAGLAEEVDVPKGRRLAAAGEVGHELFIIVDGSATVQTGDHRTMRLGPGAFFGEMSLIDGGPRSATGVARTPMKLLVVGHREFWTLLNQAPPLAAKVMRVLSHRLRKAESAHTA